MSHIGGGVLEVKLKLQHLLNVLNNQSNKEE